MRAKREGKGVSGVPTRAGEGETLNERTLGMIRPNKEAALRIEREYWAMFGATPFERASVFFREGVSQCERGGEGRERRERGTDRFGCNSMACRAVD